MASWSQFAAAEPEFAARALSLLSSRRHLTLATLRRDGSPRISGIECQVVDGELVLGMMPGSVKALDLLRDPRLALHGPTTDPDEVDPSAWPGEVKLSGLAVEVPLLPEQSGHRFFVDVLEVSTVRVGDPADHLLIESWHPGRGLASRRRQ